MVYQAGWKTVPC